MMNGCCVAGGGKLPDAQHIWPWHMGHVTLVEFAAAQIAAVIATVSISDMPSENLTIGILEIH
jgi:hypothetical protein